MSDPEFVTVDIVLPLPLDITSTLMNLVGTAYLGAKLDMSGRSDAYGREVLRMQIPTAERFASPAAREQIEAAKQVIEDARESLVTQAREAVGLSTPEELNQQLGLVAAQLFARNPAAANYLEMEMDVRNPDDRTEAFVITVRRAAGKTPHALRREAEAGLERTRQVAAQLLDMLAQLPQPSNWSLDEDEQFRHLLNTIQPEEKA